MSFPKIVYTPAGGTEQTLNFVFPPRKVPGYERAAVRHDNISTAGIRESVLEWIDRFFEFSMDWIKAGTDLANWQAFLDDALTGASFAYYPEASQTSFTNYTLEDMEAKIEYKAPGVYSLSLRFREVTF